MKILILSIVAASALIATSAAAQVGVSGYYRSNGTYVAPHVRTNPNNTINDNWTTRPNVNPYTGRVGTRSPSYGSSNYGSSNYGSSSYGSSSTYRAPRTTYGSSYGSSSSTSRGSTTYGTSSQGSSYGAGYNPYY